MGRIRNKEGKRLTFIEGLVGCKRQSWAFPPVSGWRLCCDGDWGVWPRGPCWEGMGSRNKETTGRHSATGPKTGTGTGGNLDLKWFGGKQG